jgi:hypothetical protein
LPGERRAVRRRRQITVRARLRRLVPQLPARFAAHLRSGGRHKRTQPGQHLGLPILLRRGTPSRRRCDRRPRPNPAGRSAGHSISQATWQTAGSR